MKFEIIGGKTLKGEVKISGAKNNALKILASSLLFKNPIIIKNVPYIEDVFRMNELLKLLGVQISNPKKNTFILDSRNVKNFILDDKIAKRLRASIVVVGPLVGRFKKAVFPYPGGCVIGKRPIDIFLNSWKKLGINILEKNDLFTLKADKLDGTEIIFRVASVTATETILMTALMARGKTIIWNPAIEPEVLALIDFLKQSGAKIFVEKSKIEILGRNGKLLEFKKPFEIIPDRIEAGSFLILGSLLAENLKILNCNPQHLMSLVGILEEAGVEIKRGKNFFELKKPKMLKSVNVKTAEYPGFPTDLQAPLTVLLTQADGHSTVFETIYEGRLNYIEDLNRMGAKIFMCDPHRIIVFGKTPLRGRQIESPDLRAGLAFVIAALISSGKSIIENIYQIDRGYEGIDLKLQKLGLNIKRIV
ncbi:MAG: UDP-N-acetylglucosamine 1-carboxyvinyltransferase [Patescibacteria group bacterium]|nr:UDP-N-acetylglucosamine 1-carboxyvinyltransferase [Patescibacteria group bacterium]MCX7589793.1 UDP-N-acetylglucosamine 1-carboxyvinyltransferase [Patescibacteria group bacterium]MDW8279847.1 UDP-N-acetylglucosamine 1-carboxyvinyltransferase [bacterium]